MCWCSAINMNFYFEDMIEECPFPECPCPVIHISYLIRILNHNLLRNILHASHDQPLGFVPMAKTKPWGSMLPTPLQIMLYCLNYVPYCTTFPVFLQATHMLVPSDFFPWCITFTASLPVCVCIYRLL